MTLGDLLSWLDGGDDGIADILGLSLGCEVGQSETEGCWDGCGLEEMEGFIFHSENQQPSHQ